ncbi:MAG: hypothetical protein IJA14_01815 [Alphaproteobacteria bacterium]|nr:hypothetical protein [Alphaproteobacteria bacterium]
MKFLAIVVVCGVFSSAVANVKLPNEESKIKVSPVKESDSIMDNLTFANSDIENGVKKALQGKFGDLFRHDHGSNGVLFQKIH